MELQLFNQNDTLKLTISPADNSTHSKAIMSDNVLSISFTTYDFVSIDVNDYIDFDGERFYVLERYVPKQLSTVEYEYSMQLYGIENMLQRFLVLKLVDNENEPIFSLTAPAYEHVRLIVDNLNYSMNTTEWKVGEVVATENLVLDYSGTYCDEGLKMIAEAAEVEWWIEGTTINVSKCQHSEYITLGYAKGLTELYRDAADNVKLFTRLFPIGSTRNIVAADYGSTRLQLPNGVKYVDKDVDVYGVIQHFEQEAFSHIYPRRLGTITSVRSVVLQNADGEDFTVYYFKDSALDFDPNTYNIDGLVKQITFQSGDLDGRDFEVNYNSTTKEFEIINQYPYDDGTQLPGGSLIPKVGNIYILWNLEMPQEYITEAQDEFLEAVNVYMAKQADDIFVYKAKTDYIDLHDRNVRLTIGQNVRLESAEYFTAGYRNSRITKITRNLVRPTEMEIEISDVLSVGTLQVLDDNITSIDRYVKTSVGGFPDVIKSWESTLPTDTNVNSARRAEVNFLNKKRDDRSVGAIASDKAFELGKFIAGALGSGGMFGIDENGKSVMELDRIYVRLKAYFDTIEINKLQANSGNRIASSANIKCTSVVEYDAYFRCFFTADDGEQTVKNDFVVNDLAQCREFNIKSTSASEFSNRYYWRKVVGIGDNYIDLSKTDRDPTSNDAPRAGDDIIQLGNTTDATRQNAIMESTVGTNTPSYVMYQGINSYSMTDKEIIQMGFSSVDNRAIMRVYGDCWVGDKAQTKGFGYTPEGGAVFKGTVEVQGVGVEEYIANQIASSGNLLDGSYDGYGWSEYSSLIEGVFTKKIAAGSNNAWFWSSDIYAKVEPGVDYILTLETKIDVVRNGMRVLVLNALTAEYLPVDYRYTGTTEWQQIEIPVRFDERLIAVSTMFIRFDINNWQFTDKPAGELFVRKVRLGKTKGEWDLSNGDILRIDDKASAAQLAADATSYLTEATEAGQTTMQGGVVLSNVFGVTELEDAPILENIKGGISGLKEDNIAFFADGKGAYAKAVQFLSAPTNLANILNFLVTDAGKVYMKDALMLNSVMKEAYVEGVIWSKQSNVEIHNASSDSIIDITKGFHAGLQGEYILPAPTSYGRQVSIYWAGATRNSWYVVKCQGCSIIYDQYYTEKTYTEFTGNGCITLAGFGDNYWIVVSKGENITLS